MDDRLKVLDKCLMDKGERIVIVGAGPAGLFCSYELLKRGFCVDLYDQQSAPGKKFLVAGNGGLNLTHSENLDDFVLKYAQNSEYFKELVSDFSPQKLRDWCHELGVETFVGSSGRVFPKSLKAAGILSSWLSALKSHEGFNLYLKHSLIDFNTHKLLTFKTPGELKQVSCQRVIFALGGKSWKRTGSDGKWSEFFAKLPLSLSPFLPMNCGFECKWSDYFIKKIDRAPLKNISVSFEGFKVRGEVMITPFGLEGGAIYALSAQIRNEIINSQKARILIDLKPDLTEQEIITRLEKARGKKSLSAHLKTTLGLTSSAFTLLREVSDEQVLNSNTHLASLIKNLPIISHGTRPIDEAISTSGGVCFNSLTENLEVKAIPGVYVVGEMLDFEAPTGGYLLQGCFSSAWRVINSLTNQGF